MIILLYLSSFFFYIILAMKLTTRTTGIRYDFLNPLVIYLLLFSTTYMGIPILQMIQQGFRYVSDGYSDTTYFFALIYFNLFSFFVIGTYHLLSSKFKSKSARVIFDIKNWQDTNKLSTLIFRIVILLPVFLIAIYFYNLIMQFGYNNYLANRIILLSGKGYLLTFLLSITPLLLIEVINVLYKKSKYRESVNYFHIFLILLLALLPGIILGSRTNLLLPFFLLLLSIFHLKNNGALNLSKKGVLLTILPIACLLFLGFWLEGYRQSLMAGTTITENSNIIKQIAGGFGTAENLFWWIDKDVNKLFYGSTILPVIVGLIPRSIWPGKPFGGGPAFTNIMKPGGYDQSGANISSLTTGLPFEFFMNFGFLGALIGGIIFGSLLAIIYILRSRIRNTLRYVTWIMLTYCIFMYLHSEIFGATARFTSLVFPLIAVQYLSNLNSNRSVSHGKK